MNDTTSTSGLLVSYAAHYAAATLGKIGKYRFNMSDETMRTDDGLVITTIKNLEKKGAHAINARLTQWSATDDSMQKPGIPNAPQP